MDVVCFVGLNVLRFHIIIYYLLLSVGDCYVLCTCLKIQTLLDKSPSENTTKGRGCGWVY